MTKNILSKAVGIDLGTTNSVVAVMNPTDSDIVIHKHPTTRRETTPSCVWKERSGRIHVGVRAYNQVGHQPAPIRSIKRSMGKQTKVLLTDEHVSPEEISAHILREMKQQIETDIQTFDTDKEMWIVNRSVITVPAYFDQPQIEATRRAGELAGIQVLDLLHEPTAAACYYCWQTGVRNGTFLVYDLGGGTFDVSVLRCREGAFQVLGISGDNYLGGDDIDTALAEILLERLRADYSLDLDIKGDENDRLLFDGFRLLMESVKKALSSSDYLILRDTRFSDKDGTSINIETPFERAEIEPVIRRIIEPTIPLCFKALERAQEQAGITLADVDAIILAGGSTHIPLVRELVRSKLCADPNTKEARARCSEPTYKNVDSIVALGAALHAAAVGGLIVEDPAHTLRITFHGMSTADTAETQVAGTVEAIAPSTDLTEARVRLFIPTNQYEDIEEPNGNGTFTFEDVPLQTGAANHLQCEIYDQHETLLMTAERTIVEGKTILPPPVPLPKPILLEVMQDGRLQRKELLKAMTRLPAEKSFLLAHPGNTEKVLIALYQEMRIIKEVLVIVPPALPKGTPIDLNLHVDEHFFITVRGKIGTVDFDFIAETPADREMPDESNIAKLEEQFQAIPLAPAQKEKATIEWASMKRRLEDAIKYGDVDQAVHTEEKMLEFHEQLTSVPKAQERVDTQMSRAEFDELVELCFELNKQATQIAASKNKPHDAHKIDAIINEQRTRGEAALAACDYANYEMAIQTLGNLRRDLGQLVIEAYTSEQLAYSSVSTLLADVAKARELADTQGRNDLRQQLVQLWHQLQSLAPLATTDSQTVLNQVGGVQSKLERIENELRGVKKLPPGNRDDIVPRADGL